MADHLTFHGGHVDASARRAALGHGAACLWFTGLSGSGKSTVARAVVAALVRRGVCAYVLDGDNLRLGLNQDLGFSAADRAENIRRVGELAALFVDAGVIVLTAFISPFRADRARAADRLGDAFFEVHIDPGLAACEARDPKGLYAKARAGEIADFTGISSPYEPPEAPALRLDTVALDPDGCAAAVIDLLVRRGVLPG